MDRLFFHNKHDKGSREILTALDPSVIVYDAFDRAVPLPENIILNRTPYLIDKQFVLLTNPPYYTGEFTLQLQCQDWEGNPVVNSDKYLVFLDDEPSQVANCTDGIIELVVQCELPTTIGLKITDDALHGYMPWSSELEVVEYVPDP